MAIRGPLGAYLVFFFLQVDAQSSSAPLSSINTSHSSNVVISSTPAGHYLPSTSPSTAEQNCNFRSFSVCWLHNPPYLMKDDNTGQMTGIFHDVINELISKCCGGNLTESWLNYTYQARNISDLAECMNDDFDIVFPVLFSQVKSIEYRSRRFQELMKSPGIAVVKNRKYLERSAKWNVIQEFIQTWPVFALALILNAIFGILIWALVSNPVFRKQYYLKV